jgi:HEPN domain-containing protein
LVNLRSQAEVLLGKADEDIYLSQTLIADTRISDELWGFHAQQAVEKLFKSLLASREITFPFTHQISLLTDLLEERGFDLDEKYLSLISLTPYAAALRYSFADSSQSASLDRPAILKTITDLRDFVRRSF